MIKGKYIVLEGPEGVGKTLQVSMIAKQLEAAGLPVRILREPDSQSDLTARAIRQLTQDPRYPMNTKTEVLLYNAARAQSLDVIRASVAQGITCMVDRNYLTTLAIQYYGRGDIPDYEAITSIIKFAVGDMEPDLTIIMDAPVRVLRERADARRAGERFDNLQEDMLERIRAGYLWEAKQRNLPVVHAVGTPEEVFAQTWKLVTGALAQREKPEEQKPVHEPESIGEIIRKASVDAKIDQLESTADDNEPLLTQDAGQYTITSAGKQFLDQVVTSSEDNVYAFNETLSPMTIAAAMARLSRRGDDMRVTILDEFANKLGKDAKLLQRVITAYGDDSVQQLVGQHVVVEGASNLLTKKLEWGRLASYLEQSTRYIFFDQKDAAGKYKYFTPQNMDEKTTKTYDRIMNQIFDIYSDMVHKTTDYVQEHSNVPESERDLAWKGATRAQACDAIRPVLPVATKSTVGIYASGQALESLIMHLLSDELQEARITGQKLLEHARKTIPTFLERADKPERGGAAVAYRANTSTAVDKLAKQYLSETHQEAGEAVTLVSYWPRNELDLVADMLYEHSGAPLKALQNEAANWTVKRKEKVFKTYMGERLNRRHRPGRAIEKAHYSWDIVCDYGIFRDLQRHRMVDDLGWQTLTPRYGYDVPKLVEDAGMVEEFEKCFELSLKLYSTLQAAGYEAEAQYATLLGHRMRWKVTYNAREAFHLHELRTTPQGHPGYRKLVLEMHEKLAEVHPLMAESMQFVNQDEDPELTRLAAERYTQYKLKNLKT